jgi:hypothetical protein
MCNKLMTEIEFEDSQSNPTYQEGEVGMLEKWMSMDGEKDMSGSGSQSTLGGQEESMPGYGGKTTFKAFRWCNGRLVQWRGMDSLTPLLR